MSSVEDSEIVGECISLSHAIDKKDWDRVNGILDQLLIHTNALKINGPLLVQTKVGHQAFRLQSNVNAEIAAKAKKLCGLWKEKFASPAAKSAEKRITEQKEKAKIAAAGEEKKEKSINTPSPPSSSPPSSKSSESSNAKLDGKESIQKSGDPQRDKIREQLYDALGEPPSLDISKSSDNKEAEGEKKSGGAAFHVLSRAFLAKAIEEEIHKKYPNLKHSDPIKRRNDFNGYKAKYSTLKTNLADPNNPDLNEKLYFGVISPARLVEMNHSELASDKMRSHRDKQQEWMAAASRSDLGKLLMQPSDEYSCPKCESNKCTYYQLQTRGADEPMTTFVNCLACGAQWRDGDNAHGE